MECNAGRTGFEICGTSLDKKNNYQSLHIYDEVSV